MRVAVLEDEPDDAGLIVGALELAGHNCVTFTSGRALLAKLRQETFDLLILDWNVPDVSGVDVAAWARSHLGPTPPILMVTARTRNEDLVEGLNAGADDFLIKPLDTSVLRARIHALLRRAYPEASINRIEAFGLFVFDPLSQTVTRDRVPAQLTAKEYALAQLFFRNMNRALGRAYLLETLWGRSPDLATRTLDAHVSRIRLKLYLRPENGYKLTPVYSYGYRLERTMDDGSDAEG